MFVAAVRLCVTAAARARAKQEEGRGGLLVDSTLRSSMHVATGHRRHQPRAIIPCIIPSRVAPEKRGPLDPRASRRVLCLRWTRSISMCTAHEYSLPENAAHRTPRKSLDEQS